MKRAELFLEQIIDNKILQSKFKEEPTKVLKNLGLEIISIKEEDCNKNE